MQDYKKLRVWHRAKDLSVKIINAFPERAGRKVPGLRNQVIRAATSVGANLVEGCGRSTRADFLHFIGISVGSLNEVEGYLVTAHEAGVLEEPVFRELQRDVDLVRRMLLSLKRAVERQLAEDEAVLLRRLSSVESSGTGDSLRG
jgi:four helix bundle protein